MRHGSCDTRDALCNDRNEVSLPVWSPRDGEPEQSRSKGSDRQSLHETDLKKRADSFDSSEASNERDSAGISEADATVSPNADEMTIVAVVFAPADPEITMRHYN
jgi:hypothetical protein